MTKVFSYYYEYYYCYYFLTLARPFGHVVIQVDDNRPQCDRKKKKKIYVARNARIELWHRTNIFFYEDRYPRASRHVKYWCWS